MNRGVILTNSKSLPRLILILLIFFISGLAVSSMLLDSATFDEPAHITSGYIKLVYGYFDYYAEQPPLIDAASALPLLFQKVNFIPAWRGMNQWDFGRLFLFKWNNDADKILFLSRMPVFVLFLFLCLAVYTWTLKLTRSEWYALLGFIFAGFCPNLIAHGRLATSDMGVTLFIFLSVFFFIRLLFNPTKINILFTGLFLGCALMTKVSGLILLPYFLILFVLFLLHQKYSIRQVIPGYLLRISSVFIIAVLFIEIIFYSLVSRPYLEHNYSRLMTGVTGFLSIPLHEYAGNIFAIYHWVGGTGGYVIQQYLLGSVSVDGWWYYYLCAFIWKTPLAIIILFVVSLGAFIGISVRFYKKRSSIDPVYYFTLLSIFVFILLFFTATLFNKINIGLRYILPIYPFVYLFIVLVLSHFLSSRIRYKRVLVWFLAALVAWNVSSSIAVYPSYLSYFNELIGDNREADKYLIDSNLDWGQDLKRLAVWADKNNIAGIHVMYFGGGDPSYYLGPKAIVEDSLPSPLMPGYYAVSRHLYRMKYQPNSYEPGFGDLFKDAEYITTVGKSIYIFKL